MYNFNADNITALPDGTKIGRSDELGHFGRKKSSKILNVSYFIIVLKMHTL